MHEFAGYLFAYFTGETRQDGEQVYFALSEGNDPLRWRELNQGAPTLCSTLGTRGVRDPFLIRSPDGSTCYLIATDLRIHDSWDWPGCQRHGSRGILVWQSSDLVNWTEPRLVELIGQQAGNVWAPKACYDPELGKYVVFWASKLYAADDPDHLVDSHNRMMCATTTDFVTFSEPQVWHDPGYSVIDSAVVSNGGRYYRFTKDERNRDASHPGSKFLTLDRANRLTGTPFEFVADRIGAGEMCHGEGPLVFRSNTEAKWYLFIDEYGMRGYLPFESTDLDSGVWTFCPSWRPPANARHGSVLPVTAAEYHRLLAASS